MAATRRLQKLSKKLSMKLLFGKRRGREEWGPLYSLSPTHSSREDDGTLGRNMREKGINKIRGSRQQSVYVTPTLNHKISLREPLRAV